MEVRKTVKSVLFTESEVKHENQTFPRYQIHTKFMLRHFYISNWLFIGTSALLSRWWRSLIDKKISNVMRGKVFISLETKNLLLADNFHSNFKTFLLKLIWTFGWSFKHFFHLSSSLDSLHHEKIITKMWIKCLQDAADDVRNT